MFEGGIREGGEEHDRLLRMLGEDSFGRLEPGQARHAVVEDDDVGFQIPVAIEGLLP